MKIGYSEFSFGYAFTENLIRSSPTAPLGAPVFPNLQQEGHWGFDININFPALPLFFQYKLPELMTRNNASEVSTHHLPGLAAPFFRMPLMRSSLSQQHQKLIELEQVYPGTVLYASPCLRTLSQFNLAYNAARVHERSVFFSPTDIGPLPDTKDHSVAYQDGLSVAYFCSEPRKINAMGYEGLAQRTGHLFEQNRFRVLRTVSRELRDTVRSLASPQMRASEGQLAERLRVRRAAQADQPSMSPQKEQTIEDILVAREMARVDLGVDVLIAQPRK